jgi:radical SAM-linked protein
MYRLRVRFQRGEAVKFISHLDLTRLWQRACQRAGIPLAYSEGFSPHPRISLAAPLALGVTSEAELMDIFLARPVSPHFFMSALKRELPVGIEILQVQMVAPNQPSLQAQLRFAEYQVSLATSEKPAEIAARIDRLISLESLPWQHQRDTGPHHYDLRALVDDLWLTGCEGASCTIGMRLRSDAGGSGRPEQVSLALGFVERPELVHRTRLILEAK